MLGYLYESVVVILVFLLIAGQYFAEVSVGQGVCIQGIGHQASCQRAEGNKGYSQFLCQWQNSCFDIPGENGVFALQGADGVNGMCFSDGGNRGFGKAQVTYFSFFYEVGHGAYRFFYGYVRIDTVGIVEIDHICSKSLEALFYGYFNVGGRCVK